MKKYLIPIYVLLAFIFTMLMACCVYFLKTGIHNLQLINKYPGLSIYDEEKKAATSLILYGVFALVAVVADLIIVVLISIKELPILKKLHNNQN